MTGGEKEIFEYNKRFKLYDRVQFMNTDYARENNVAGEQGYLAEYLGKNDWGSDRYKVAMDKFNLFITSSVDGLNKIT